MPSLEKGRPSAGERLIQGCSAWTTARKGEGPGSDLFHSPWPGLLLSTLMSMIHAALDTDTPVRKVALTAGRALEPRTMD